MEGKERAPPATPDDTRVEPAIRGRTPGDGLPGRVQPLGAIEEVTEVDAERSAAAASAAASAATLEPKTSLSTLAIGDVIGEGGMGIVREAIQLSLARRVAVKEMHAGASEADAVRMLREAWVTGFLEHPGVVPIYDIAKGRDGPVVLMRRIEGETWHHCLGDAEWAAMRGARDLLEQNLRVFVRVCEIVEFAHAKGVIHRDIKPANIMIGAFGEVYLLDWGLALALHGEAERHLPTSAETREIGGTMSYAAPEMVELIDAPMTERTDIYLLGALLFELATGARPHTRASDRETIASIDASPPPVPDGVPLGLARPIRRAMQRLPKERYQTVAQLRLDVLGYLRSRDSEHLASAAEHSLARLAEACVGETPARLIHELHAECRFGFREALRTWPENVEAKRGLVAASTLVIEREVARDPLRALALLDEVDGIAPALAERVRSAASAKREEEARLAQMARDNDGSIGRGARRTVLVVLGLSWAVTLPLGERFGPVNNTRFALGALSQLVFLGILCAVARGVTRSLYNRRILAGVAIVFAAQCALFASAAAFGMNVAIARTLQIGMWSLASALLAVFLERRLWPMAVVAFVAFVIAVADPSLRSFAAAVAAIGMTANMALVASSSKKPA